MCAFNGKIHLTINSVSIVIIAFIKLYYGNLDINYLNFVCGSYVGCLLPDGDTKESIAGSQLPLWLVMNHGKITHTLLFNLFLLILYYYVIHVDAMAGITWGVFNHLIGDTNDGYPLKYLWYPYIRDMSGKSKKGKKSKGMK